MTIYHEGDELGPGEWVDEFGYVKTNASQAPIKLFGNGETEPDAFYTDEGTRFAAHAEGYDAYGHGFEYYWEEQEQHLYDREEDY